MISERNIAGLIGIDVADADGHKIGTVGQIYVDPATGRPNWATVRTGLFGTSESFVPLEQAEEVDRQLRIPYPKDVVKHAPRIGGDESLSDAEQDRLYDYYRESTDDERDRSDEHQRSGDDIDRDAINVVPGTGGPDDFGDVDVDPEDLNMPGQS